MLSTRAFRVNAPLFLLATSLATFSSVLAQGAPETPTHTLKTRWAAQMSPERPLPEYPRPQLVRTAWTNLNGRWDYAIRDTGGTAPTTFDGKIVVPFAVESQLSGVQRMVKESQNLWYHRTFTAPKRASGDRVLLHFGAVDWDATVFVNGKEVGRHRGGFDPFSFDVTDALTSNGTQELVVRVWDPTNKGSQPRGKQVQEPQGIFYTAVTGIWQTVWLEAVPATYLADLKIVPDIDAGVVRVWATAGGADASAPVTVSVLDGKKVVGSTKGKAGDALVVSVPKARLWSPSDPFLYTLTVKVGGRDVATSYVGMRKIGVERDANGHRRLALNGKILFQYGPLDQGWWPDGLYTAPTDEALRFDIEKTKALGFNMIRKHVKVEPARWYYHADKLGMLVWQDMPSADNRTPESRAEYKDEMGRMIHALYNFPSIVMWVPFNEGWGQHDTEQYTAWVKQTDPSRLVNNASGWTDTGVGDVSDAHVYPGPGAPLPDSTRAAVLGEFGGLGLPLAGHTWEGQNNWGYRQFETVEALSEAYQDLMRQLRYLISDGLSAAVYTQTTDVESEVNGVLTYDREVVKLSPAALAEHATLYGATPVRRVVLSTSREQAQTWRYSIGLPDTAWMQPGFNDTGWKVGDGGFGMAVPIGYARMPVNPHTTWTTNHIWIRRTFTLPSTTLTKPHWRIHHTDDAEVYLNGTLVGRFPGRTSGYTDIPMDAEAVAALRQGANTLAVHARGAGQGQYFDIGIDEILDPPATK